VVPRSIPIALGIILYYVFFLYVFFHIFLLEIYEKYFGLLWEVRERRRYGAS
jgi:hypothetical protein